MINCGGIIDLEEFLSLPPASTVYIFDNHRPIHLSNMYSSDQVSVLCTYMHHSLFVK